MTTARSPLSSASHRLASRPAVALPLAALVALAALLRFPTLDLQSFWFDEAVTVVDVLRPSLVDTLARVPSQELAPPLYFVLAWAWSRPFGIGEVGLRSLSALIGTLTVPVAYAAGAELVSRRAGLAAAALTAVSPLLVYYSQEARPYALVILLGGLSFWLWVRALQARALAPLAAWALVSALALCAHYFAVFLVVPEALWLLAHSRGRRAATAAAVGTVGITGLALMPLALTQLGTGGATWIGRSSLLGRALDVPEKFVAGWQSAENPAWPLPALLVLFALWLVLSRGDEGERRGTALALAIAAVTLLVPIALALGGLDFFTFRHLVVVAVPLIVGLAVGFAVRRAPRAGALAAAALCVLSVGINAAVFSVPRLQRDDWRAASAALGPPRAPRIIALTSFAREPVQAYGHRVESVPSGVRVSEIALLGNTVAGEPTPPPPVDGFRAVERREVQKLTLIRYRSRRPLAVSEGMLVRRLRLFPHAIVLERP